MSCEHFLRDHLRLSVWRQVHALYSSERYERPCGSSHMEPDGGVQGQEDKDKDETNPSKWLLKDQEAIHGGSARCHELGVERGAGCLRDSDTSLLTVRSRLVLIVMSNQYAHLYQQQRPQLYDGYYRPQPPSQPSRPQPSYQHAQPLPPPVSPAPLLYHSPISAPSPQYPQQFQGAPHVVNSSPSTSPVSSGLSRRPLPTPGAPPSQFTPSAFRPPLPTPGPTPVPTSPQPNSRTRRGSNVTVPSHQPASSLPSTSPTSPTSGRRPLPLPRSAPGSSLDTAARSSSPAKDVLKSPAPPAASTSLPLDPTASSSQTKFVPYWKRTLPDPSSDRAASASSSQEAVNPGPSGSSGSIASPNASHQLRDRSKSFTTGRPLPPSPLDGSVGKPPFIPSTVGVFGDGSRALPNPLPNPHPLTSPVSASIRPPSPIKLATSSSSLPSSSGSSALFSNRPVSPTKSSVPSRPISPASSDDDGKPSQNGKAHQNDRGTPSPQYGIRDLPPKSRSVITQNSTRHTRAPASVDCDPADEPPRGRPIRSSTLPKPPPQSLPTQSSHRLTQSATVRSAPVLPAVAGPSRLPVSTPTSPTGWPNTLPPLPRAPIAGTGEKPTVHRTRSSVQEYVNLDDAPPPSLRRSPSPSAVSSRTVSRIKTQSMASNPRKGFTHDAPITQRRSAASVPSSPEKISINLPQISPASAHQGTRSRSVTPASIRQPLEERPRVQPPSAARPPPSAFSQRFVSGKPPPSEPQVTTTRVTLPHISTPGGSGCDSDDGGNASIFVSEPELPQITFSDPTASSLDTDYTDASPIDEIRRDHGYSNNTAMPATGGGRVFPPASSARRGGGLACGGCGGPIVGRIVSAMGVRWHPGCFRCSDCDDLLEYVSSYERDGKPYCHFDYHEVCGLLRSRIRDYSPPVGKSSVSHRGVIIAKHLLWTSVSSLWTTLS